MNRCLKLTAAMFLMGALLVGCSGEKSTGTEPEKGGGTVAASGEKIKVYLLPKNKSVSYFTSCDEGAEEAAKELGDVDLVYDGPTKGEAEVAARLIEQWTLKDATVIAVSPNDPAVVGDAMKKAREAGVKVITWDADAAKDTREFLVNQATPEEIGFTLVDTLAKDLGGPNATGEVAIVTATLTAKNQNDWIEQIKKRLPKYPGLKLIAIKPSDDEQRKGMTVTQDLMKAYPNLKGIFAISSVAFPGVAEAIKQAGMSGKVMVTGLSQPNDMRKYVEDGTVKSVVLWNTKDLGYLTVYAAHALAKGELKEGSTSLKAGRLGEKKVVGDNVMLGQILVFTKDNIKDYNF